MSVADQLGLWDETSELLALADQSWGHWATAYPALTHCCGVRELRSWLPGADMAEAALRASGVPSRVHWFRGDHDIHAQHPKELTEATLDAERAGLFDRVRVQ